MAQRTASDAASPVLAMLMFSVFRAEFNLQMALVRMTVVIHAGPSQSEHMCKNVALETETEMERGTERKMALRDVPGSPRASQTRCFDTFQVDLARLSEEEDTVTREHGPGLDEHAFVPSPGLRRSAGWEPSHPLSPGPGGRFLGSVDPA